MPVAAHDRVSIGGKRAFYIQVVLGIVQKRPEPKPRGHQSRSTENSIENGVDFTMT